MTSNIGSKVIEKGGGGLGFEFSGDTVEDSLYNRIKFSGPTFWEDTDRGNTNIYYSPDSDKIDDFKKMLSKQMKGRLEKLDRDVQILRLELDKLSSKEEKTPLEKEKIIELEEKINTRRKTFFIK